MVCASAPCAPGRPGRSWVRRACRENLPQSMDDPNHVARIGLNALAAGEFSVIAGYTNWIGVQAQRLAPRRFVTSMAEMVLRPAGK